MQVKSQLNCILLRIGFIIVIVYLLWHEENISINCCPDLPLSHWNIIHTDVMDYECHKIKT